MSLDPSIQPAAPSAGDGVLLEVRGGVVRVVEPAARTGVAQLAWPAGQVDVVLSGEPVAGTSCRVSADAALHVDVRSIEARIRYEVQVSRDRMEATLRVVPEPGVARTLRDQPPSASLRLLVEETRIEPGEPSLADATAAIQRAGIAYGLDHDAVAEALDCATEVVVARGTDAVEGRAGRFEHLVDFEALRSAGVLEGTPLVRRIPRRDGVPGRDVTGQELRVSTVKDVRLRPGAGVVVDERGMLAIAAVDGAPHIDAEGRIDVRHELVLETVDHITGDIEFHGSVRVQGDVHEGRRIVARDAIFVGGNVDRGHLESGGNIEVQGSIMSSTLRAGGERAVAATIADRVLDLPRGLGLAAAQARQFREVAEGGGKQLGHGLSIQLVMERHQRQVLVHMASIIEDLREAGPSHVDEAERVRRWLRQLSTAANIALTPEQFGVILVEVGALADDVQRAIERPADLVVSYMQASEAEATGSITLMGKGIFNSRVVAWAGLRADHFDSVVRGGSVASHGLVRVREIGSPAGAKTVVQLAAGGGLQADRAYAGSVIVGPGYSHRFVADRSDVRVEFDGTGSMNVESLAA